MDDVSILTVEQLDDMSAREFLRRVLEHGHTLTVFLPDGEAVVVQPKVELQPLPVLNGHVPDGWKEAIYTDAE